MARAVAWEICMMPFGPVGLSACESPQLSRYAMAEMTGPGMPLRSAAELKIFCIFGLVMRSAPSRARESRMMANVCASIIRRVRSASIRSLISPRSTPIAFVDGPERRSPIPHAAPSRTERSRWRRGRPDVQEILETPPGSIDAYGIEKCFRATLKNLKQEVTGSGMPVP